jgi:hypothetical protein
MGNTKQVREMLKEHGVSEEEYAEIVKNSGMSKEDYNGLALEYNAPKGITWKEMAKIYEERYPLINIEGHIRRMKKRWEDGEFEDIQAFTREFEEGIKKFISPQAKQIYIDEQDNNIIRNDGDAEHRVAVKIIKKQKRQLRALKLHRHKPTQMEMKEIIDKHRFKSNDKANCTKIGNELGIDPETAKRWIQKLGLSDYAFNPKHLK